jgi:hypothetical protein
MKTKKAKKGSRILKKAKRVGSQLVISVATITKVEHGNYSQPKT